MKKRRTRIHIPNVRLALTRVALNLSQGELGNEAGISASAIYWYEVGMMQPKSEVADRVSNALGVGRTWLFQEAKPTNPLERAINQLIAAVSQASAEENEGK